MIRRIAFTAAAVLVSAAALAQAEPGVTRARDFQITGTIDCGQRSGADCTFADWATGPLLTVITRDLSGNEDRVVVDASWVRDDLGQLEQDDFVRFELRDDAGPRLRVIGIAEHRCRGGTFNQGLSTQTSCVREQGDVTNDNDDG